MATRIEEKWVHHDELNLYRLDGTQRLDRTARNE
jgi:hypothetical protein